MTLSQIIRDVAQKASIDTQNQTTMTNMINWVNLVQQDISHRYTWPWLATRFALVTTTDKTAGTVTSTLNSTTITGVSTSFASTDVGRFIQTSETNDWYQITAVASSTSLTLETGYGSAGGSAQTYTIRTFSYTLPADLYKIYDVRQSITPIKLQYVDTRMMDLFRPSQTSTGTPRAYFLFSYSNPGSSTGQQWGISFEPIPSAAIVIEIRYLRKLPNLTLGTDVSAIPEMYHNVLIDGTLYHAMTWLNNPSTGGIKGIYELGIQNMKRDVPQTIDNQYVIQAIDQMTAQTRFVPFPETFGPMSP